MLHKNIFGNSTGSIAVALRHRSRKPLLLSGVAVSAIVMVLAAPLGPAWASDCGKGGAVVGGECELQPYDPTIDENGGSGANAVNNNLNPVTVTGGDTVTLTGNGSSIAPGQDGGDGTAPLNTFPIDSGGEYLNDIVLDRGPKNDPANFHDEITGTDRTINVYKSSAFQGPALGDRQIQTYVAVQDNQYIDTRIGDVESSGGTLNVDIDGGIDMAAKQTTLFQADGTGGAQSTINWTSSNSINLHGATMPSEVPVSTSSSVLAGWPTTVSLPDGTDFLIEDLATFQAFNDKLVDLVELNGLGLGSSASQAQIQAKYDELIAAGANFQSGTVQYSYDLPPQPDDIFEPVGTRTVMKAIGANAGANIASGVVLDVNGANGGVQRAEEGAHIVNNGTVNNTNGTVAVLTGGSTGSNEGVINSRTNSNGVSVTDSSYDNNNIINQEAGGTAINATNSDTTNDGIINVGTKASSANVSAIGVNVNGGSFTNTENGTIYIGRGEQDDPNAPAADVALNLGGNLVGINVAGAADVTNAGDIVIGTQTQGAVGLKVDSATGSTVDNSGTITVKGAVAGVPRENVGYLVRNVGADAAGTDGSIKNSGAITVEGTNATALKILANGANAGVESTGPITVAGGADPTSGTRNYGVWAEGTGAGTAYADISGDLILTGNGAIGVHARGVDGNAVVNVTDNATPQFSEGTDQIGFFIYGAGASINTSVNEFEVSTERSTLFRIAEGAKFDGSDYVVTASGKDSKGIVGTGTGTTVDTSGTTFNLTGQGATALVIEGGATGTSDATTIFNLDAADTVAGVVDGQKHSLSGSPVGAPDANTKLTNSANVVSDASGATGFIARNTGTLDTTGDITLSGSGSTGLLAEDSGKVIAKEAKIDVNGWAAKADGGDANSFTLTDVTAIGSDGLLDVAGNTIVDFSATGSDLTGRMLTAAGSTSNVDLTGTKWTMNADSNVTKLTLAGTDVFFTRDGGIHKTLTVAGDYSGTDSALFMNTYLGTDGSSSDLLHVGGNTLGTTLIHIENTDGIGEQTLLDGIMVVQVDGQSDGKFILDSPYVIRNQEVIFQGAWGYTLQQNGKQDSQDGDWYLRTEFADGVLITAPGVPIYEAYPGALLGFNQLPTLQQRVGNRYWNQPAEAPETVFCKDASQNFRCAVNDEQAGYYLGSDGRHIDQSAIWARVEAAHNDFVPSETTSGMSYDQNLWKFQAGVDGMLAENEDGKLIGGVNAQYGTVSTNVASITGGGDISTTGKGIGASLTWYGVSGLYVDAQANATWYDSDLNSNLLGSMVKDNGAFGYAFSIEAGKRIELGNFWAITPQAQLTYSHVDFDSFTDQLGADVSLDDGASLQGRLGLAAERQNSWKDESGQIKRASFYGIGNLYYEFLNGTQIDTSGEKFATRNERLWGGIGIGGSYSWHDDKYALFGEVSANTSLENFGDSDSFKGNVGVRVNW